MAFEARLSAYRRRCEGTLEAAAQRYFTPGSVVSEAARYALLGGGKRVRGVFTLAVGELFCGSAEVCDAFSAAVEMVHAFSLVHDDLPCMDDDALRRGKPAAHIQFGEAMALLAGDMLAIEAFNVIEGSGAPAEARGRAVRILAGAAGAKGMIYGQELDLQNEARTPDEAGLRQTHRHKTGALICAAANLGVVAAGLEPEDEAEVGHYAEKIGLVFQIVDDILDVSSTAEALGKPIGSDAKQGKATFVTMFGMAKARQQVAELTAEATETLFGKYGERSDFLCAYARRLAGRIH